MDNLPTKLVFIYSQAAVQRYGDGIDLFEQNVAAFCEARHEENYEQGIVVEVSKPDSDEMCLFYSN